MVYVGADEAYVVAYVEVYVEAYVAAYVEIYVETDAETYADVRTRKEYANPVCFGLKSKLKYCLSSS